MINNRGLTKNIQFVICVTPSGAPGSVLFTGLRLDSDVNWQEFRHTSLEVIHV